MSEDQSAILDEATIDASTTNDIVASPIEASSNENSHISAQETGLSAEEITQIRTREVTNIGNDILTQAKNNLNTLINEAGDTEEARQQKKLELSRTNPSYKSLLNLQWFENHKDLSYITDESPNGLQLQGEPLVVLHNGQEYQIRYIREVKNGAFTCVSTNTSEVTLNRDELTQSVLIRGKDSFISLVSVNQQEALKTHIEMQQAKSRGETYTLPEDIDGILESAAVDMGQVTAESASVMIEDSQIDDRTKAQLRNLVRGKVVMDTQSLAKLVANIDIMADKVTDLEQQVKAVDRELASKINLLNNTNNEADKIAITQEINDLKKQKSNLEFQIDYFDKNYPHSEDQFTALFDKVYKGEIKLRNPNQLNAAIRNRNLESVLTSMIDDPELDLPTEQKEKYKTLLNIAKVGGVATLALLFVLLSEGIKQQ